MTTLPERQLIVELIQEAVQSGARLSKACAEAQIALRTYRRWFKAGVVQTDLRPEAVRMTPANKLSDDEQNAIIELCNQRPFVDLPPTQIVPTLMDQGVYVASESSFYRILKKNGQLHHRGKSRAPQRSSAPSTHIANGPCEVWCWDITYCVPGVRAEQDAQTNQEFIWNIGMTKQKKSQTIPLYATGVSLTGSDLRYARRVM